MNSERVLSVFNVPCLFLFIPLFRCGKAGFMKFFLDLIWSISNRLYESWPMARKAAPGLCNCVSALHHACMCLDTLVVCSSLDTLTSLLPRPWLFPISGMPLSWSPPHLFSVPIVFFPLQGLPIYTGSYFPHTLHLYYFVFIMTIICHHGIH